MANVGRVLLGLAVALSRGVALPQDGLLGHWDFAAAGNGAAIQGSSLQEGVGEATFTEGGLRLDDNFALTDRFSIGLGRDKSLGACFTMQSYEGAGGAIIGGAPIAKLTPIAACAIILKTKSQINYNTVFFKTCMNACAKIY